MLTTCHEKTTPGTLVELAGGEPHEDAKPADGPVDECVRMTSETDRVEEQNTSSTEPAAEDPSPPVATEEVAPDSPVSAEGPPSEAGEPGVSEETPPVRRGISIGTQRAADAPAEESAPAPKPKPDPTALGAPVAAPREADSGKPTTVPTPSVRQELADDVQAEYEAALASGDLDSMMLGGAATAEKATEVEPDARIKAKVISVNRDRVFFDLGSRHQGMAALKQFNAPPEVGAKFEVLVGQFEEEDGIYQLTIPGAAIDKADWSNLAEGVAVDALITGHNKGGLECEVSNIRGFIPMSQISTFRVDKVEEYVGQRMTCIVTEVKPEKKNLVLSRRAQLEREAAESREKMLASLAPGQTYEGTVRTIKDYGAFVDLGGVDGLLHVGQLSWDRIKHPSDVLEVGQKITVKIQKIDEQTGKISLSYRETFDNPWNTAAEKYSPKTTVSGTVTRIADFGGFVKLEPGIEGLIHVSELSHRRVPRVTDVLTEGQEVEAMVLSVDVDKQRIGLSLKALESAPQPAKNEEEEPEEEIPQTKRKPRTDLKGGLGRSSGGEQFGLKW